MWNFVGGAFVGLIVGLVVLLNGRQKIEYRQSRLEKKEQKLKAEKEQKLKAEKEQKLKAEKEQKLKAEQEQKLKAEKEQKMKEEEAAKERKEEKRKMSPVCPKSKKCQNKQCNHRSQTVCSNCYVHLCSECHKTDDKCSLCNRQGTVQTFGSSYILCDAEVSKGSQHDFDCFLNTCKHVFHKECLLEWYKKEKRCLVCQTQFDITNISTDFFDPKAHY
ncbi:uncharacterized protein LOC113468520 [Diaphorina citri]|uniref:Uncharacterized protein LOC113468520 n=1 Tax=Diaphorina citri TaxID=121845 RepID=A0A3Q0J2W3_DIACI|nr:uncharacterized protein LOC113468520 [Diaphorina citri]